MTIRIRLALALVLAAALCAPVLASAAAKAPARNQVVTVAWGEDISRREGFLKLRSQEGIDYFVNLRERFELKGYAKPTVFYGQASGRLYAVHLRLSEQDVYDRLGRDLTAIYGKGKRGRDGGAEVTRWKAGPVRVKLKKDDQGAVKLSFYYQPVASTLDPSLREAEFTADDLAKAAPADQAGVKAPGGQPARTEEQVGIDVLKYLKEGRELLRLDIPRYRTGQ